MPEPRGYDPYRLLDDVEILLAERGFTPQRLPGRTADRVAGASRLLRGFGLEPRRSPEDGLDLDGHLTYHARTARD